MIGTFDKYITAALKKAEKSLIKIFRCRLKAERIKDWEVLGAFEAGKVAKVVFDAIRLDVLSHGSALNREHPLHIGNAANFTKHEFPDASIFLVDATTYSEDWTQKSTSIQAKSIRPFLPFRGAKNDAKYVRYIRPFLDGDDIENPNEIAEIIAETKMRDGKYRPSDDVVFKEYAPKISLLYCSWDSFDRSVLMLRPSSKDLNGIAYRAYCDIVMDAIVQRHAWDMDFKTVKWNRVDIANSMAVADSQLMVREHEMMSKNVKNADTNDESIRTPRFLLKLVA